jgi:hypothetical protein
MENALSKVALAMAAVVAVAIALYATRYINPIYMPLVPCEEAAKALVENPAISATAVPRLIMCGERGLQAVRNCSDNFRKLNPAAAIALAEILERSNAPSAVPIARELYSMSEPSMKLVGAVGLASHGCLSDFNYVKAQAAIVGSLATKSDITSELTRMALKYEKKP